MADINEKADKFFEGRAASFLARDPKSIARMHAVPSLVLFAGQVIPVTDVKQTEEFVAASWSQYDGVDAVDKNVVIMGGGGNGLGRCHLDAARPTSGALLLSAH